MRWRTYERLTAEHDAFVGASLAGMARRFNLVNQRLPGLDLDLDDLVGDG